MVATLVRYECKKCVTPRGQPCPCSIEQLWYPTDEITAPKVVQKQWCLVPKEGNGHMRRAEWVTTKYIKMEE